MPKEKPESTVITLDFAKFPEDLKYIKAQAEQDDRSPANWLRRFVVTKIGRLDEPEGK
jgi:hypothetical protein